jgi:hypothetical protein
MKVYKTEDRAINRVFALNRIGIWPAIKRADDGWVLTYNPDVWE